MIDIFHVDCHVEDEDYTMNLYVTTLIPIILTALVAVIEVVTYVAVGKAKFKASDSRRYLIIFIYFGRLGTTITSEVVLLSTATFYYTPPCHTPTHTRAPPCYSDLHTTHVHLPSPTVLPITTSVVSKVFHCTSFDGVNGQIAYMT